MEIEEPFNFSADLSKQEIHFKKISADKPLVLHSRIGSGTYGDVYKASLKGEPRTRTTKYYAVKYFKEETKLIMKEGFGCTTLRELSAVQNCGSHPNILAIEDLFIEACPRLTSLMNRRVRIWVESGHAKPEGYPLPNNQIYVFAAYEYCDGGDIKNILLEKKKQNRDDKSKWGFSLMESKLYAFQLLNGLSFLHSQRMCHRDLKPDNLMLLSSNEPTVLKIGDLGLCREFRTHIGEVTPTICTIYYRPLEVLLGRIHFAANSDAAEEAGDEYGLGPHYGLGVDVWSAGCILAELVLGRTLFKGTQDFEVLTRITKILGTPTEEEWTNCSCLKYYPYHDMDNSHFFRCEDRIQHLNAVLEGKLDVQGLDLLSRMLCYNPHLRITSAAALSHPWFEDLNFGFLDGLGVYNWFTEIIKTRLGEATFDAIENCDKGCLKTSEFAHILCQRPPKDGLLNRINLAFQKIGGYKSGEGLIGGVIINYRDNTAGNLYTPNNQTLKIITDNDLEEENEALLDDNSGEKKETSLDTNWSFPALWKAVPKHSQLKKQASPSLSPSSHTTSVSGETESAVFNGMQHTDNSAALAVPRRSNGREAVRVAEKSALGMDFVMRDSDLPISDKILLHAQDALKGMNMLSEEVQPTRLQGEKRKKSIINKKLKKEENAPSSRDGDAVEGVVSQEMNQDDTLASQRSQSGESTTVKGTSTVKRVESRVDTRARKVQKQAEGDVCQVANTKQNRLPLDKAVGASSVKDLEGVDASIVAASRQENPTLLTSKKSQQSSVEPLEGPTQASSVRNSLRTKRGSVSEISFEFIQTESSSSGLNSSISEGIKCNSEEATTTLAVDVENVDEKLLTGDSLLAERTSRTSSTNYAARRLSGGSAATTMLTRSSAAQQHRIRCNPRSTYNIPPHTLEYEPLLDSNEDLPASCSTRRGGSNQEAVGSVMPSRSGMTMRRSSSTAASRAVKVSTKEKTLMSKFSQIAKSNMLYDGRGTQ